MPPSIHDRIDEERKAALPEAAMVKEFRNYYRGRQRSTHTTKQAPLLRGLLGNLFCANACRKIVNETASRHELLRFQVESETVAKFLDEVFVKNRLADLQQQAGIATLRDGNHALALRWKPADPRTGDGGRVTVHRERWWDGTSGVFVAYGDDGEPTYAVKEWKEPAHAGGAARRVVWFPDRIERYVRQGDGWRPYRLEGDPAGSNGTVPWVKRDGSPLHIPVVHLANGSDDDAPYGASELDGGVLGVQDEINDIHRDISSAARLTGFQMYWATGTEPKKDEQGNDRPLLVGPGQVLQSGKADARYGVLPAGDLAQLKEALVAKQETIGWMTDTPYHLIAGDWPSGEALVRADMPQANKTNRLNKSIAPRWGTVGHRSTEIFNTFGDGPPLDEDALITAVFAAPERLDAMTQAQVAAAREAIRTRQGLKEIGFTDKEADEILAERSAQADADLEREQRRFDRGGGPPAGGEET